jgi:hypothetical protein
MHLQQASKTRHFSRLLSVWALLCVAERRATGQTESGGIVLAAICWAQRRCHPEEAV